MTIELWLVPLIFAYAFIGGIGFRLMEEVKYKGSVMNMIIAILWLPSIALIVSTYVAAKVLGDEGN